MATRVMGEDEGNCKGGKSNGNEDDCLGQKNSILGHIETNFGTEYGVFFGQEKLIFWS